METYGSWLCSSVGEHRLSGNDNEIIFWRYPAQVMVNYICGEYIGGQEAIFYANTEANTLTVLQELLGDRRLVLLVEHIIYINFKI